MIYSREVEEMCPVAQGVHHGAAPIPEEAKWVQAKEVKDISGFTHGVGWCAPQQGACKLSLNVKEGIIQEALVETIGCSGMTHSAAMASEILPGLTVMEALNTDLVCDAINTAMRELFLQIVYGRSQSAFSEDGLAVGAGLEDLGKGLRSQVGTMYGTLKKGRSKCHRLVTLWTFSLRLNCEDFFMAGLWQRRCPADRAGAGFAPRQPADCPAARPDRTGAQ